MESSHADSELPDSALLGSELLGSELLDTELLDTELLDTALPDSELPDSELLDTALLDTALLGSARAGVRRVRSAPRTPWSSSVSAARSGCRPAARMTTCRAFAWARGRGCVRTHSHRARRGRSFRLCQDPLRRAAPLPGSA